MLTFSKFATINMYYFYYYEKKNKHLGNKWMGLIELHLWLICRKIMIYFRWNECFYLELSRSLPNFLAVEERWNPHPRTKEALPGTRIINKAGCEYDLELKKLTLPRQPHWCDLHLPSQLSPRVFADLEDI